MWRAASPLGLAREAEQGLPLTLVNALSTNGSAEGGNGSGQRQETSLHAYGYQAIVDIQAVGLIKSLNLRSDDAPLANAIKVNYC